MRSSPKVKALSCITAFALLFVVIAPFGSLSVNAQATTGILRGIVEDASGGVVAGATVTAKNSSTGTQTTPTVTSSEGTFDIPGLLPGSYVVTDEAPGFKRSSSTNVLVKVGIVNPLDVKLEAGNISETVT